MVAKRAKQLYFTRHDDDLWQAIQQIKEGEQNHEIRKALRFWFLGEGRPEAAPKAQKPVTKGAPDADSVIEGIKLPTNLLR